AYPRRGSNPRWTGFKPAASANWATGAPQMCPSVLEETLDGLAPELAVFDRRLEHRRRVVPLALAVAVLHRAVEDVEAAEVEQVERPHRPVEALLHRDV